MKNTKPKNYWNIPKFPNKFDFNRSNKLFEIHLKIDTGYRNNTFNIRSNGTGISLQSHFCRIALLSKWYWICSWVHVIRIYVDWHIEHKLQFSFFRPFSIHYFFIRVFLLYFSIFFFVAECDIHEFDKQWYESTIVSQEDWVCSRDLYQTNAFVLNRIGEVIGTFFFGQLGDR